MIPVVLVGYVASLHRYVLGLLQCSSGAVWLRRQCSECMEEFGAVSGRARSLIPDSVNQCIKSMYKLRIRTTFAISPSDKIRGASQEGASQRRSSFYGHIRGF